MLNVNKRVKGWVITIERKLDGDWVAMQVMRFPKIGEVKARRFVDDLCLGYTKQGLIVRGSLSSEAYLVNTAEELSTQ